jgi:hypothetical protein
MDWGSTWDFLWHFLIIFAWIAYLIVMFQILTDLFWRDHKTSGFVKAVWIIALIFLPFLTSIVYLVARGSGMADRNLASAERMRQQQEAYIRDVASPASPADQISKAQSMLESGVINQSEFEALKAKALA